jgi:hypothetical protein
MPCQRRTLCRVLLAAILVFATSASRVALADDVGPAALPARAAPPEPVEASTPLPTAATPEAAPSPLRPAVTRDRSFASLRLGVVQLGLRNDSDRFRGVFQVGPYNAANDFAGVFQAGITNTAGADAWAWPGWPYGNRQADGPSVSAFRGLAQVGVLDFVHGDFEGLMQVGLASAVRGSFRGLLQIGVLGAATGGDSRLLLQLGGVYALAKEITGVQVGGLSAVASTVHGLQIGSQGTLVSDSMEGLQLGGVNITAAISEGAGSVEGAQLGAGNFATVLRGVQVGAVNLAMRATGLQLGAVNFAEHLDGVQIGAINIAVNGPVPFMPIANAAFD